MTEQPLEHRRDVKLLKEITKLPKLAKPSQFDRKQFDIMLKATASLGNEMRTEALVHVIRAHKEMPEEERGEALKLCIEELDRETSESIRLTDKQRAQVLSALCGIAFSSTITGFDSDSRVKMFDLVWEQAKSLDSGVACEVWTELGAGLQKLDVRSPSAELRQERFMWLHSKLNTLKDPATGAPDVLTLLYLEGSVGGQAIDCS
ncbi:hypothetical protein [Caballeronia sp. AAUFL_F1_KS47]|uniref:hypothetical protein n=1 Tax=Caballeronia sp. AAUFL_F1_KS47 TaxID=2921771 RepID=UPI00202900A7|nr:hypothetical protein [Caballeronia sp. AAUFL_F1_KS47]